jgi:hypothetical protein
MLKIKLIQIFELTTNHIVLTTILTNDILMLLVEYMIPTNEDF